MIDIQLARFRCRGLLLYAAAFIAGLVPFAVWILVNPLGRTGFRAEYLARIKETPWAKLAHEGRRYSDVLGLHQLHVMPWLPVRLPILLILLIASRILWKHRRNWFYLELTLLLPTLLWFVETANKSSRYFALTAPVIGMTLAGAIVVSSQRWSKPALYVAATLVSMQFLSNVVLLQSARSANYTRVGEELRRIVPAAQPVYGTITLWLAFYRQPFIAYERTLPGMAEETYNIHYFVLGDRMMTQGGPWDAKFYSDMNVYLAALTQHSTLVGQVTDQYYGALRVYRTQ